MELTFYKACMKNNESIKSSDINPDINDFKIGAFEKNLTWWVLACILVGIVLGKLAPNFFQAVALLKMEEVNLPVAVLIWLMIIPMLLKIDFSAMREVLDHGRGIGVTLLINWLVKPLSMALLAWIFIRHLFADLLPAAQIESYIAGLILLAAAPCTAMVFVWSNLCNGEPKFTLSQVAINDAIMLFAFAPLVALLLGLSSIEVPWNTLFLSVLIFIVVPVVISQLLRYFLIKHHALEYALKRLQSLSLLALLTTLILLFGFQGQQILNQPIVIGLLAIPIIIQTYFNSLLAYWLNKKLKVAHCIAGPSALIGASNFFELAVATAIAIFGFNSGAALATVVGVLVEVPVMLSIVAIVNKSRQWYEAY